MTRTTFPGPGVQLDAIHEGPEGAPILTLAHGAGGGIEDELLSGFAAALDEEGVATLRFTFAYRAAGRRAPDREPLLRDAGSLRSIMRGLSAIRCGPGESRSAAG